MSEAAFQVLLLQPWVEDFYATDCRIQPIGLCYLAGALDARFASRVQVTLFDCVAGGTRSTLPWPREFAYLKRYYGQPDSGPHALFHSYYRFGRSERDIKEFLATQRPDLIGISALFSPYYRESLALAALCKSAHPNVPIVMGGNHATLSPETLLLPKGCWSGEKLCDFVLRGEAEDSLGDLVEALRGERSLADVRNLVTSQLLETWQSPPSPIAPTAYFAPRFPGLRNEDYCHAGKPMRFLVTSRSCPHRCSFCSVHAVFGKRYRTRSADDIVSEVVSAYQEGIRHFDIEDDNFSFDKEHALTTLRSLAALQLPDLELSAMNGLSYLSLDEEVLTEMSRAGFRTLNLALVSSDQSVLRFSQRPHGVDRFFEVARIANALGLRVTAYAIFGMPGQTLTEMVATLRALAQTQCLVGASPFYFTPGSPIHLKRRNDPTLRLASAQHGDAHFAARLTAMDVESDTFARDDIYTLFRLTRVINDIKAGIDSDLSFEHAQMAAAREVWQSQQFATRPKHGMPKALPFSRAVAQCLEGQAWMISGYRTSHVWNMPAWTPRHFEEITRQNVSTANL